MPHAMQIWQTGGPEVLKQFWQFIKYVFYIPERRQYLAGDPAINRTRRVKG
jgi:hypothetical protein